MSGGGMSGGGMRRLIALWQELEREHVVAGGMGLKDQIQHALIGTLAFGWVVVGVLTLAIEGGWL